MVQLLIVENLNDTLSRHAMLDLYSAPACTADDVMMTRGSGERVRRGWSRSVRSIGESTLI